MCACVCVCVCVADLMRQLGKHPTKVGPDSGVAGVEAELDIQYIMSVGQDVKTYFWSTPGLHEQQEPFLEWIMALSNSTAPPLVNRYACVCARARERERGRETSVCSR